MRPSLGRFTKASVGDARDAFVGCAEDGTVLGAGQHAHGRVGRVGRRRNDGDGVNLTPEGGKNGQVSFVLSGNGRAGGGRGGEGRNGTSENGSSENGTSENGSSRRCPPLRLLCSTPPPRDRRRRRLVRSRGGNDGGARVDGRFPVAAPVDADAGLEDSDY